MLEFISQTWAWYVSGILLALIMFLLLWSGGEFGVSTNLRTMCTIGGAGKKISFFDFNWKSQIWNLIFVLGSVVGGFIATKYLSNPAGLTISENTVAELNHLGILFDKDILPAQLFSWNSLSTLKGFMVLVVGGFFVGFGARWAGGCTSGHAISGLSNLQLPSLIAVVGFFIGGLIMTHLLFPLIF